MVSVHYMLIIITTSGKPHKNTMTQESSSPFSRVGNWVSVLSLHYTKAPVFQASNLNPWRNPDETLTQLTGAYVTQELALGDVLTVSPQSIIRNTPVLTLTSSQCWLFSPDLLAPLKPSLLLHFQSCAHLLRKHILKFSCFWYPLD